MQQNILKIGLTGGICSGKSTVAKFFQDLGIEIIDADVIARDLVEPKTSAFNAVVKHFGKEILHSNGTINRAKLREIIFANPVEKEWLESLLHPRIYKIIQQQLPKVTTPFCIIVIPLLLEKSRQDLVDIVLVVDTTAKNQISRLMQRYKISAYAAKKILANQLPRKQRLRYANDVIVNNTTITALEKQVIELYNQYKRMC
jgi:dephospho-CoA kinase